MLLFRIFTINELNVLSIVSDASAVTFLLSLIVLAFSNKTKRTAEMVFALVISIILLAATLYYNYYGSLPTYQALGNMKQIGQIGGSIRASFELYSLLYFVDFVLLLLSMTTAQSPSSSFSLTNNRSNKMKGKRVPVFMLAIAIAGIAGSLWHTKDIENNHLLSKRLGILNYQLAVAMGQKPKTEMNISPEEIEEMKRIINEWLARSMNQDAADGPLYFAAAKGGNVIVLQLEAFQNFVIGLSLEGQEITPVLNELMDTSFYFPYFYQQIGEGNTSDAEFLANTSIYPLGSPAMSTLVGGKVIESLPRILSAKGYASMTLHVNDISFWQRNELYPALGFDQYFDKPFFENDKFNSFGASDHELYRVALEQFKKQQQGQPFYAQLVTVSSHHPFRIAEQFQKLILPENLIGTQLGDYLQAIHYADEQIGIFIDGLKEANLWDTSMLVLYGDHSGLQPKDNEAKWISEQLNIQYNEITSRFNIPLMIRVPTLAGETIDLVGGQIDIMPTIANLLGISLQKEQTLVFGSDLLNAEENIIGMRYYMPTGTFFNDEVMYVPGESFDTGYAVNYRTLEAAPLSEELQENYIYMLELLRLSDLFFTQYQQLK